MTFGILDCWKKQKFTHEIATKNTKSRTPDCKQTQTCTPENKKSHTRLPKSNTNFVAKDTKSHSTRLQKKTQSNQMQCRCFLRNLGGGKNAAFSSDMMSEEK
jgi:ubiquitin